MCLPPHIGCLCRSKRQRYFAMTAGALLCLQTLYTAVLVASLGSVLAQADCRYPWTLLAILELVQVGWVDGLGVLGWRAEWADGLWLGAVRAFSCLASPEILAPTWLPMLAPQNRVDTTCLSAPCPALPRSGSSSLQSCCSCWRAWKTC
jgi:hypothetical protein